MSIYRKPLIGGGSRLIERGAGGRFTRTTLDCKVCADCGQILFRDFVDKMPDVNGRHDPRQRYPENCPKCGGQIR